MPIAKRKLIRFSWVLPAIYVFMVTLVALGLIKGAGHGPNPFDFLVYGILAPCHLLDFLLPRGGRYTGLLVPLVLCFVTGLATYFVLGLLIDFGLSKYRNRKRRKRSDPDRTA